MSLKKWNIPKANAEMGSILAQECGVSELVSNILINRGHKTYLDAQKFLNCDEISSPLDIKDMQKAVERITRAIEDYEKVAIYGDYDCDGVTSTAMLYRYLETVGADVIYYIPERDGEGYGLNKRALKSLFDEGISLIITVDNGISAIEEIDYANELGMEVVVTDHHQPSEALPNAYAIVNPHRKDCSSEFKELCGAGVCFKLICAMEDNNLLSTLEWFGDLVAIGTIGDVMPLISENRALVKYGLDMLKNTENVGIRSLINVAGISKINATAIAFSLVPRINAAGRMGKASLAVKLLLCEDEQEAAAIAQELNEMNVKRQEEEKQILLDIETEIAKNPSLLNQRVLILHNENWNHGIIGIVCSKMVERFSKPVLLLTGEKNMLKGSGRSLGEFHLFKALSANSKLLTQYGGHKLAAGFSLFKEDFEAFKIGMEEYAKTYFDLMPQYTYNIDKVLEKADLTVENIDSLKTLEPFGSQSEQPLFLIKNAVLKSITPLSQGKHQRLSLEFSGINIQALLFNAQKVIYKIGSQLDLLVNAELNSYNDTTSVSIKIKDIHPSVFEQNKFFAAKGYYEKIAKREDVPANVIKASSPSRDDIAVIYRLLKGTNGYVGETEEIYLTLLDNKLDSKINFCKLNIILDVLCEASLIKMSPMKNKIEIIATDKNKKVDLNQTETMAYLVNTANI